MMTISCIDMERIIFWVLMLNLQEIDTLQGTNISHLGKRKTIFKSALVGNMLVPGRVPKQTIVCFVRV